MRVSAGYVYFYLIFYRVLFCVYTGCTVCEDSAPYLIWWYGEIGRRYVDFRDRFVNGRIWILNQNTYHAGSSPATTTNH